jgi:hypothetical protein
VSKAALAALVVLSTSPAARAQDLDGYFSVLFSTMPDVSAAEGRQAVTELRSRLFGEGLFDVGDHLHLTLGAYVDGLVADRGAFTGTTSAAVVRPADFYAEVRTARFDLRAGMSRIVWGRLDELQPSDVVNPIDVSRFFLEGRSEARLPVAVLRGRAHLPGGATLEGILVPVFRAATFDQLDEASSPFNLREPSFSFCLTIDGPCSPSRAREEPSTTWRNLQGGGRVSATVGRVDVGTSAYRGFESFPVIVLRRTVGPTFSFSRTVETFPRFTMIAGDFESVSGPWGVRGEAAYFIDDTHQLRNPIAAVPGRSLEGGIGVDRRAGDYRISGNVLVSRRTVDDETWSAIENTDVTLIAWAERTFARETRAVRLLGLYNPEAGSAFVRLIAAFSLRDNVWLETSAGWLDGDGADTISGLSSRDFLYARLKVHF